MGQYVCLNLPAAKTCQIAIESIVPPIASKPTSGQRQTWPLDRLMSATLQQRREAARKRRDARTQKGQLSE
jgi:hypothetical protein